MRVHFSLGALLLLGSCLYSSLKAQEIIVVKTRSIPIVEDILSGFQTVCSDKHALTVFDMEGKQHQGEIILDQIQNTLKSNDVKAVFTIGLPATVLIKQTMTKLPMIFAMVRNPQEKGLLTNNISGISQDLSAETQLQYLKKALPQIQRVGIIYSHATLGDKITKFEHIADQYNLTINRYSITSIKEVPKTLRQVIVENDALILLPDKMVINQASLEYFVTTLLENGFPTLGYNQFLVKSGILMALVPNYIAIGRQAGDLLCNNMNVAPSMHKSIHFDFVVNAKTAQIIKTKTAPELLDSADVIY